MELKPCPFCGCEVVDTTFMFPEPDEEVDWKMIYSMMCDECHACTSWFTTKEEAIAAWNRRADDD